MTSNVLFVPRQFEDFLEPQWHEHEESLQGHNLLRVSQGEAEDATSSKSIEREKRDEQRADLIRLLKQCVNRSGKINYERIYEAGVGYDKARYFLFYSTNKMLLTSKKIMKIREEKLKTKNRVSQKKLDDIKLDKRWDIVNESEENKKYIEKIVKKFKKDGVVKWTQLTRHVHKKQNLTVKKIHSLSKSYRDRYMNRFASHLKQGVFQQDEIEKIKNYISDPNYYTEKGCLFFAKIAEELERPLGRLRSFILRVQTVKDETILEYRKKHLSLV